MVVSSAFLLDAFSVLAKFFVRRAVWLIGTLYRFALVIDTHSSLVVWLTHFVTSTFNLLIRKTIYFNTNDKNRLCKPDYFFENNNDYLIATSTHWLGGFPSVGFSPVQISSSAQCSFLRQGKVSQRLATQRHLPSLQSWRSSWSIQWSWLEHWTSSHLLALSENIIK